MMLPAPSNLTLVAAWAAAALVAAALASWYDWTSWRRLRVHGRIPNGLTAFFWALSLLTWCWLRGWPGVPATIAASLAAGAYTLLPGFRGGGGDFKLAAAFGAALGLGGLVPFILLMPAGLLIVNLGFRFHQAGYSPRVFAALLWLDLGHQVPPIRIPGALLISLAAALSLVSRPLS